MIFEERHFEYGDFISRTYGLIFAHADTSTFLSIAGEVTSSYIFNKKNNTRYAVGDDYTDSPLSFDIDIITDDYRALTMEECRAVKKILFNKPDFKRLYVDLADDCFGETFEFVNGEMKRLYLNCKLMNPEKIEDGGGRVVGFKCTVECDCGYLIQDEIEQTFVIDEDVPGSDAILVTVDTDTNDYVYPIVTIKCKEVAEGETATVIITSGEGGPDDTFRSTRFYGLPSGATVRMNGETNSINENYYEYLSFGRHFVRLRDGVNLLNVAGDVESIVISWANRRFL